MILLPLITSNTIGTVCYGANTKQYLWCQGYSEAGYSCVGDYCAINKCVGSTMCIQYAPKVFGLNDDRQSTVINPDGESAACIRAAAEQCPMEAVTLEDANTGQQVFP